MPAQTNVSKTSGGGGWLCCFGHESKTGESNIAEPTQARHKTMESTNIRSAHLGSAEALVPEPAGDQQAFVKSDQGVEGNHGSVKSDQGVEGNHGSVKSDQGVEGNHGSVKSDQGVEGNHGSETIHVILPEINVDINRSCNGLPGNSIVGHQWVDNGGKVFLYHDMLGNAIPTVDHPVANSEAIVATSVASATLNTAETRKEHVVTPSEAPATPPTSTAVVSEPTVLPTPDANAAPSAFQAMARVDHLSAAFSEASSVQLPAPPAQLPAPSVQYPSYALPVANSAPASTSTSSPPAPLPAVSDASGYASNVNGSATSQPALTNHLNVNSSVPESTGLVLQPTAQQLANEALRRTVVPSFDVMLSHIGQAFSQGAGEKPRQQHAIEQEGLTVSLGLNKVSQGIPHFNQSREPRSSPQSPSTAGFQKLPAGKEFSLQTNSNMQSSPSGRMQQSSNTLRPVLLTPSSPSSPRTRSTAAGANALTPHLPQSPSPLSPILSVNSPRKSPVDSPLRASPSDKHETIAERAAAVGQNVVSSQEGKVAATAVLQEWEVHEELGRGAYGIVYKGTWCGLPVAIKRFQMMPEDVQRGTGKHAAAVQEADINRSLDHPNIVMTYSSDMLQQATQVPAPKVSRRAPKQLHIVMEYCDGGSLVDVIEKNLYFDKANRRPLLPPILALLIQVAKGCTYLHSKQIIHGDLKPDNVLLLTPGAAASAAASATTHGAIGGSHILPAKSLEAVVSSARESEVLQRGVLNGLVAKVADFGLSKILNVDKSHLSGVRSGTPLYVALEIMRDGKTSKAADVYSFGVMMWELYHGKLAWHQYVHVAGPKAAKAALLGCMYDVSLKLFEYAEDYTNLKQEAAGYMAYAELGRLCLNEVPANRPTFEAVLHTLKCIERQQLLR
ncbi:hypothetical protein CEUSTIGMA_g10328.t1 [Chlamydomonas eustigma]|uniref:Protein kinase domain-containing protein n=1 Tax=Chlamydomonas eustigma TaxID=1157962 RepID=A0A250XJ12_9CHLO|nr:hypothetical protein CEUSTIGMA_g10328.t1 [Chlamydomonas eustigma]|eukprot:GAX82902.1 hypothetical protein CEUSTIGMA_g10328.t1 [Chlamydomonas eustigma]